jgi:hypothetical protein
MTQQPVVGTVTPELIAFAVQDFHYKTFAAHRLPAMHSTRVALADSCPIIQMEEPQIPCRGAGVVDRSSIEFMPRSSTTP